MDNEGCFYVRIYKSKQHKIGWGIYLSFEIGLNSRDKDFLLQVKSFFYYAGNIYENKNILKLILTKDGLVKINNFKKLLNCLVN